MSDESVDPKPVPPNPWTLILEQIQVLRVQQAQHAERTEAQMTTIGERLGAIDVRLAKGAERIHEIEEDHAACQEWRQAHDTSHRGIEGKVLGWALTAVGILLLAILAAILTGTIKVL